MLLSILFSAGIAQAVERGSEKPGVPSASLGPGTLLRQRVYTFGFVEVASVL